jgi:hypothetical protein
MPNKRPRKQEFPSVTIPNKSKPTVTLLPDAPRPSSEGGNPESLADIVARQARLIERMDSRIEDLERSLAQIGLSSRECPSYIN